MSHSNPEEIIPMIDDDSSPSSSASPKKRSLPILRVDLTSRPSRTSEQATRTSVDYLYSQVSPLLSADRLSVKFAPEVFDFQNIEMEKVRFNKENARTEEGVTEEHIFQNIRLHKEVLSSVKQQPWPMRKKIKLVKQAKKYVKRHEGELQERLAQSKTTKDMLACCDIIFVKEWQFVKRELANFMNVMVPWELRIKEIESHFGSVVASYFTFLRWLFWVNLMISLILLTFVAIPEIFFADYKNAGERKKPLADEAVNATRLITLWDFEGVLKYSPLFYGYYNSQENSRKGYGYKGPLAYFITGIAVYIYSFVATLKRMAQNSRQSKLSEKDDECVFTWKLFTGWDYMIGNSETAHNRTASIILGFKEALLEEAEKKRDERSWKMLVLRALINLCVLGLFAFSVFAVVSVVKRSANPQNESMRGWWKQNEVTIIVSLITNVFPFLFEILGSMERYHPRKRLRMQLGRCSMATQSTSDISSTSISSLATLLLLTSTTIAPPSNLVDINMTLVPPQNVNKTFDTSLQFIPPDHANRTVDTFPQFVSNNVNNNSNELEDNDNEIWKLLLPNLKKSSRPVQGKDFETDKDSPLETSRNHNFPADDNRSQIFSAADNKSEEFPVVYNKSQEPPAVDNKSQEFPAVDNKSQESPAVDNKSIPFDWSIDKIKLTLNTQYNVTDIDENNRTLPFEFDLKGIVILPDLPRSIDLSLETHRLNITMRRVLRNLCWETVFGQELGKRTEMDLVLTIISTLMVDFIRALFVRVMNNCWCWDLEKKFPQYGDFKIAENILHLVNNQGMVWMGMFFSPGLPLINLIKLAIMMYLRSWAVLTCNVPHEVVFRASRSNNFYLALLLTMLFLCVLPVSYAIVWVEPSWHCGPFSNYPKIYYLFTNSTKKALPKELHHTLDYIASPGIVIPLLMLLILIIYYLISLTNSLREANNDLKVQLRRERTEERRKVFQMVDRKHREKTLTILPNKIRLTLDTVAHAQPVNGDLKSDAKKLMSKLTKHKASGAEQDERSFLLDETWIDLEPTDTSPINVDMKLKHQLKQTDVLVDIHSSQSPVKKIGHHQTQSNQNSHGHVTKKEVGKYKKALDDNFKVKGERKTDSFKKNHKRKGSASSVSSEDIPEIVITHTTSTDSLLDGAKPFDQSKSSSVDTVIESGEGQRDSSEKTSEKNTKKKDKGAPLKKLPREQDSGKKPHTRDEHHEGEEIKHKKEKKEKCSSEDVDSHPEGKEMKHKKEKKEKHSSENFDSHELRHAEGKDSKHKKEKKENNSSENVDGHELCHPEGKEIKHKKEKKEHKYSSEDVGRHEVSHPEGKEMKHKKEKKEKHSSDNVDSHELYHPEGKEIKLKKEKKEQKYFSEDFDRHEVSHPEGKEMKHKKEKKEKHSSDNVDSHELYHPEGKEIKLKKEKKEQKYSSEDVDRYEVSHPEGKEIKHKKEKKEQKYSSEDVDRHEVSHPEGKEMKHKKEKKEKHSSDNVDSHELYHPEGKEIKLKKEKKEQKYFSEDFDRHEVSHPEDEEIKHKKEKKEKHSSEDVDSNVKEAENQIKKHSLRDKKKEDSRQETEIIKREESDVLPPHKKINVAGTSNKRSSDKEDSFKEKKSVRPKSEAERVKVKDKKHSDRESVEIDYSTESSLEKNMRRNEEKHKKSLKDDKVTRKGSTKLKQIFKKQDQDDVRSSKKTTDHHAGSQGKEHDGKKIRKSDRDVKGKDKVSESAESGSRRGETGDDQLKEEHHKTRESKSNYRESASSCEEEENKKVKKQKREEKHQSVGKNLIREDTDGTERSSVSTESSKVIVEGGKRKVVDAGDSRKKKKKEYSCEERRNKEGSDVSKKKGEDLGDRIIGKLKKVSDRETQEIPLSSRLKNKSEKRDDAGKRDYEDLEGDDATLEQLKNTSKSKHYKREAVETSSTKSTEDISSEDEISVSDKTIASKRDSLDDDHDDDDDDSESDSQRKPDYSTEKPSSKPSKNSYSGKNAAPPDIIDENNEADEDSSVNDYSGKSSDSKWSKNVEQYHSIEKIEYDRRDIDYNKVVGSSSVEDREYIVSDSDNDVNDNDSNSSEEDSQ
ncbi:hypothetical protein LSTR_LSTR011068 [Laodelphax striatellus]|uniref:TMC domain-containing protein n=1 Tax=Laodelphax striatellus TaxID=195883 RepID=A0A482XSN5_LAOST|nr:hypothetical protein LSTR_LSTR011068 [Laodelphax striatellus]